MNHSNPPRPDRGHLHRKLRHPEGRRAHRSGPLLGAVVVAVIALVAAACSSGGDEGSGGDGGSDEVACPVDALEGADGPVEITVWRNFNALPRRTFEAMVEEYNTSQDRVVVDFQPQGISFEEVLRKYKLAAEDDSLPALALLEDTTTQVMADSGTIIPGEACFDADPDGKAILDDFLPIAVASYTVDGQLQPVGFDVYTALVFYNRSTLADAGLDPDTPPGTLEEIRSAAEAIKASGAAEPPVAVLATAWQTEWWLTGVGQPIVNENNGRDALATASEFDSDATAELFGFWRSMVDDGLASPHPGTEGQTNHLFAMATNSASIVVESSAAVNTIAGLLEGSVDPALVEELGIELPPDFAGLDLDLAVGPFPGIEEPGQGQIGGGAGVFLESDEMQPRAARRVGQPGGPGGEKIEPGAEAGLDDHEALAPLPARGQGVAVEKDPAAARERVAGRVVGRREARRPRRAIGAEVERGGLERLDHQWMVGVFSDGTAGVTAAPSASRSSPQSALSTVARIMAHKASMRSRSQSKVTCRARTSPSMTRHSGPSTGCSRLSMASSGSTPSGWARSASS